MKSYIKMLLLVTLFLSIFPSFGCSCNKKESKFVKIDEVEGYEAFLSANSSYVSPRESFTVTVDFYSDDTVNDYSETLNSNGYYSWNPDGSSYTSNKIVADGVVESHEETWTVSNYSNFYYYVYTHGDKLNGIDDKYERKIVKSDYAFYSMVNDESSLIVKLDKYVLGKESVDFIGSFFNIDNSSEQNFFTINNTKVIDLSMYVPSVEFYGCDDIYRLDVKFIVPNKKEKIKINDVEYNYEAEYNFSLQFEYTKEVITNIKIKSYQLLNYDNGVSNNTHKLDASVNYTYENSFDNSNMRSDLSKYVSSSDDTYVDAKIHYHLDDGSSKYETRSTNTNSFKPSDMSSPKHTSISKWYLDKKHTVEWVGNLVAIPSSHLDLYGKTIADAGYAIVILEQEVRSSDGKLLYKNSSYNVNKAYTTYNIPTEIDNAPVNEVTINDIVYTESEISLRNQGYYHIKLFSRVDK